MVVKVELDLRKISPMFREELAKQISDSEVLSILSKDNDSDVRAEVAVNENTLYADLHALYRAHPGPQTSVRTEHHFQTAWQLKDALPGL